MKNWKTLEPDKYALVGSHRFTKGRTRKIDRVVIHHNAGANMTTEDCRNLWNNSRQASAHYQVEADGTIGQIVHDRDTAWHAANADVNARSIGIEHANISGPPRWQISDKTIEEGAHLVAALCHGYGLGRPQWGKNMFPHSQFAATSCPFQLDVGGEDHATYIKRAQYWYDQMSKPAPAPAPAPVPAAVGSTDIAARLDRLEVLLNLIVDQFAGPARDNLGPKFTGWPQLDGLTPVDAIGKILTILKEKK